MSNATNKKRKADDGEGDYVPSKLAKVSPAEPSRRSQSMIVKARKKIFPFLAMPRELRDMVYREVWLKTPYIKTPHEGIHTTVRYDGEGYGPLNGLPTWLHINKQNLEKGMKEFRRKGLWVSNTFELAGLTKASPPLRPSTAREFYFGYAVMEVFKGKTAMSSESLTDFKKIGHLIKSSNNLKVLHIYYHLSLWVRRILYTVESCSVDMATLGKLDLSPIEDLDVKLDKLEIVICRDIGRLRGEEVRTALKLGFEAEVERVGELLIGGKKHLSFEECSCDDCQAFALDSEACMVRNWKFSYIRTDK